MILTFHGQYHGEGTYLTASTSTDLSEVTSYSSQYVSGLVFAPYPNSYRASGAALSPYVSVGAGS